MNKKRIEELKIIDEHPKLRPYGSYISFILGDSLEYGFDGETSLLLDAAYIVRMLPDQKNNLRNEPQKLTAVIEGFITAKNAEEMGLKLTLALLWSAVSKNWSLKLIYDTPMPAMVFDRKKKNNIYRLTGHDPRLHVTSTPDIVSKLITEVLSKNFVVNPKLLISMELFASAKLESSERAKFVSLVSALEALSKPMSYKNQSLDKLVSSFISTIDSEESIPDQMKESIKGRALLLNSESIIQSIVSFVKPYFPENNNIVKSIKESYKIRSKILHEGKFDADLDEKRGFLENILRHIYSQILNLKLQAPIDINAV